MVAGTLPHWHPLGLWDLNPQKDKKNNVTLMVKQSKKGDDYASLAKQLGLKRKAADKFVAQLTKQFGTGGNDLQLSKMGGIIGRTFSAAETGLSEQTKWDAKDENYI